MNRGPENQNPSDKPNFFEFVFGEPLTQEQLDEDRINRHFAVENMDSVLERAQQYIDEYGDWEIILPKTVISYGFIAAVATVMTGDNPPELVFIDQPSKMFED
ncbi:MAG TPA: hypothetical protein VFW90_03275 [Candidatus Saccharimonadales bacterium]|nr:hypothetical protein [Candidatus Saccharimonadales bacterium]